MHRAVILAAILGFFTGCGGGGGSVPPLQQAPVKHLYLTAAPVCCGRPGTPVLLAYALPLTPASMPIFTMPGNAISVAVDPTGKLATGTTSTLIQVFDPPFSPAGTPAATFGNSGSYPSQLAFVGSGPNAGDLWSTDVKQLWRYTPPFSGNTAATMNFTPPAAGYVFGPAFDSAANLYLASDYGSEVPFGDVSSVFVYAPPYRSPPLVTGGLAGTVYRDVAAGSSQLFVAAQYVNFTPGFIDVYALPITPSSVAAFSISNNVATVPAKLAVDGADDLYVMNNLGRIDATSFQGSVSVYAPPYSAASLPRLRLDIAIPSGFALTSIAVEK